MARITDINYYEDWELPYVETKKTKKGTNNYSLGVVPLSVLIEYQPKKKRKIKGKGICEICNVEFDVIWSKFCRRKNSETKMRSICGPCAIKVATNSNEWKEKNSKSQLKVQGTLEARKKMSNIIKEVRKNNTEINKKISESLKRKYKEDPSLRKKISEASKRNWENSEYKEKVSPKGFHHGIFHSICNGDIFFASSWELMFLVWCDDNKKIISFKRCEDRIPYEKPNGKMSRYHPDFNVGFEDEELIIEVKGSRSDFDLVSRKRKAAQDFYKDYNKSYVIMYKEDLKRIGCYKGSRKKLREWIKSLAEENRITYYGGPKKEDKENIQGKSIRSLR